jgi:hypothetical protein
MGLEDFHTRQAANEGRRLPLYRPDGGQTDQWLQVRHVWSDAFLEAEEASTRAMQAAMLALGAEPPPAAVARIKREARVQLLAALVAGWSFEAPCTPEAVAQFLVDAPQIADQIDRFAADARGFFGHGSPPRSDGSNPSDA